MILSKETALFQKGAIANLASSSKYITKINDSGIKIHPYDDTMGTADANHFLSLTAEGMQIYNGGTSNSNVIAKFNTTNNNPTVTIGFTSTGKYNTHITQDGLYLRTGTDSYAALDTNGLTISTGGIKGGISRTDDFVFLSSMSFDDAISGHDAGTISLDNYTNTDWRQLIGTKFGVRADGTLYASNAYITGDIVATSLTIGSGNSSYSGTAAINATSYDIEIINDVNNIPDEYTINSNNTYLYPIIYHNGINVRDEFIKSVDTAIDNNKIYYTRTTVEEEYIYTRVNSPVIADIDLYYERVYPFNKFLWYEGNSSIAIIGDVYNGGIVAEYGKVYKVIYNFSDDEIGEAQTVQTVYIDDTKYITKISDTGITIHPENNSNNNFLRINSDGIDVVKNNITVATFGTTAQIGANNSSRFLMNADSLQAYNSSNTKYFEVNENGLSWGNNNTAATTTQVNEAAQTAAQTATNYIKIDGSGIKIQSSGDATNYLYINSDKIAFFKNGIEKMQLTDSSLRLGDQNEAYTTYTNSAIEFYNTSDVKTVSIENGAFKVFENNKPIFRVGTFDSYFQGVVIGDGHLSPTCLSLIGYTNTTPSSTTPIASVGSLKASADESEYGSSAQLMLSAYSGTDSINHYINIYAASGGWSGIEASTSISINSDERLKENFQSVGNLSDILFTIQPVIYSWKDKRTGQRHLGFKAQDIQQALSVVTDDIENFGLVNKNKDGYLNLSYTELIPLLVDVIQKHEKRITELESQIEGGNN